MDQRPTRERSELVTEIQKKLRPKQLAWVKITNLPGDAHRYGRGFSNVKGYSISIRECGNLTVGENAWVSIVYPQTFSGYTVAEPYTKGMQTARLSAGDIVFGKVESISETGMTVNVLPRLTVSVTNYEEVLAETNLAAGDSCCVILDKMDAYPFEAHAEYFGRKISAQNRALSNSRYMELPEEISPDQISINRYTGHVVDEAGMELDPALRDGFISARTILAESFRRAKSTGMLVYDDAKSISFPIYTTQIKGVPCKFAGMRQYRDEPGKWYIEFIGNKGKNSGKAFLSQVRVSNTNDMFSRLSKMALPERWCFKDSQYPFEILDNFFSNTYYGAWIRGFLVDAFDADTGTTYRIFNTGLVNYHYNSIFCVLKSREPTAFEPQHWEFVDFADVGDSATPVGKMINRIFPESSLPKRIDYISKKMDILYLTKDKAIPVDYSHILGDNIDRMPPDFFLNASPYAILRTVEEIVARMKSSDPNARSAAYKEMSAFIAEQPKFQAQIKHKFDAAVGNALMRADWNYKAAVPTYFPSKDCISLLLPLTLSEEETPGVAAPPDVALVVSRQEPSGNYQGETILTLSMAYLCSRLLTRPDSDWLTPDGISLSSISDEDSL